MKDFEKELKELLQDSETHGNSAKELYERWEYDYETNSTLIKECVDNLQFKIKFLCKALDLQNKVISRLTSEKEGREKAEKKLSEIEKMTFIDDIIREKGIVGINTNIHIWFQTTQIHNKGE
jgi:hypothetical protein